MIVCWLTLLFIGFGLFAPRNGTVLATLVICATCASMAIFLCAEMNGPLDGVMKVSSSPVGAGGSIFEEFRGLEGVGQKLPETLGDNHG